LIGYLTGSEDYYSHSFCYTLDEQEEPIQESEHAKKFNNDPLAHFSVNSRYDDKHQHFCGTDLRSSDIVASNYSGLYSTNLFTEKAISVIEQHARYSEDEQVCSANSCSAFYVELILVLLKVDWLVFYGTSKQGKSVCAILPEEGRRGKVALKWVARSPSDP
jgi:hypothetical protein